MSRAPGTQAAGRDDELTLRDRAELAAVDRAINRRRRAGRPVTQLEAKRARLQADGEARLAARRDVRVRIDYPASLPISEQADAIRAMLETHPVVIVCGDTGSGKTTQLPKICLQAGRGIAGAIGHTQPRRLAAWSVGARLADELDNADAVGVKVRFADDTGPRTLVKLMTDGILLNEIRDDRRLYAYDTLIIDEAHERSLNIDFLLGYLKQLLAVRRDLKVIVTSATIDPERFAAHFGGAPVIEVSGRSHPVEIRYRPPGRDVDSADAVVAAANELAATQLDAIGGGSARDVLVFLPGERWIRNAEKALSRAGPEGYDILPLYARLPADRQKRIFKPGGRPRIVLATNIAETSLTVPRIRFVIDTGLARISRYQPRHRLQQLAVEPIAQANAIQRAGRCGRIAPGICVRLYSLQDFEGRPAFIAPELLRTNLAGAILSLETMQLGPIGEFPFIDAPPDKAVKDGYRLLHVLGAFDADGRLTQDGRIMGRLPVDPRLGRLLLSAARNGSLEDALTIAAALSVADPRDSRETSERAEASGRPAPSSDFDVWLELWRDYRSARSRGGASFRDWCQRRGVAPARLNEWADVRAQLTETAAELGTDAAPERIERDSLHKAVLAAFVDYVFEHIGRGRYRGVHEASARLDRGSAIAARPPRWIVAAEHVGLGDSFLRTAAAIDPRWVGEVAPQLLRRTYREPVWNRRRGRVEAIEVTSLPGLVLDASRRVDYGAVDPAAAHAIFVRDALVADALGAEPDFLVHNRNVRVAVLELEARQRSHSLFVGDRAIEAHYLARLPDGICSRRALMNWCRQRGNDERLRVPMAAVVTELPDARFDIDYPLVFEHAGQQLPLEYRFDPADERDGITLRLPAVLLESVPAEALDWLVPGWLADKLVALLRTLPKELRRPLVPLPDTTQALLPALTALAPRPALTDALARLLAERYGMQVDVESFRVGQLPRHLLMRIAVLDGEGDVLAAGRDLRRLQRELAGTAAQRAVDEVPAAARWHATGLKRWTVPDLPDVVDMDCGGSRVRLFPALVDRQGRVDLKLLPPGDVSLARHRAGVRRLLLAQLPQQTAALRRRVRGDRTLLLAWAGIGSDADLADDIVLAAADQCFDLDSPVRSETAFRERLERGRADFVAEAETLMTLAGRVLAAFRRVRAQLDRPARPLPEAARADVDRQLQGLVHPRMLGATPPAWRPRLPVYIDAIGQRLAKLEQRHPKDALHQASIDEAAARLERWRTQFPPDWPLPTAVERYRWLLEEFRVSLYAQALGTTVPVSARRLEQAWHVAVAPPAG